MIIRPSRAPAVPAGSLEPATVRDERLSLLARQRTRQPQPQLPDQLVEPDRAPSRDKKRRHHVVDRSGDNWTEDGDYIVGKGRPPKNTRWKPGQSGNPSGPKARKPLDPQAALEASILAPFAARVNGADVELNLGEFSLNLLKTTAAKGSVKAQQILINMFLDVTRKRQAEHGGVEVNDWEQEAIEDMLAELGLSDRPVFRQTDRSLPTPGEER